MKKQNNSTGRTVGYSNLIVDNTDSRFEFITYIEMRKNVLSTSTDFGAFELLDDFLAMNVMPKEWQINAAIHRRTYLEENK